MSLSNVMINVYTEDEATTTRDCPMNSTGHCSGSDCMVWLWQENVRCPNTLEEVLIYGYCGLGVKRN